jgi:hypothetical protein
VVGIVKGLVVLYHTYSRAVMHILLIHVGCNMIDVQGNAVCVMNFCMCMLAVTQF